VVLVEYMLQFLVNTDLCTLLLSSVLACTFRTVVGRSYQLTNYHLGGWFDSLMHEGTCPPWWSAFPLKKKVKFLPAFSDVTPVLLPLNPTNSSRILLLVFPVARPVGLPDIHVPNLISLFRCVVRAKESVQVRGFRHSCFCSLFSRHPRSSGVDSTLVSHDAGRSTCTTWSAEINLS
jgi:hypothetical protein